ncbi:hypothetical protein BURCENBC7_AP4367 [Burkholderia cenocepacia BC7]|nr:uncharacterized protein BCN122_II3273 [Burkholderia cenocepacia]EPZ88290.1 hypothetical protein BURCENK562V_C5069 [Burkholderia cenocepacia K56-2Valvano]ERI28365.1 hypothetical protein BURCENBC7_AP4367 [Burkholderia cenocepacia BC7]
MAVGSGWQGQSSQVYRRGAATVVTLGRFGAGRIFARDVGIGSRGRSICMGIFT